MCNFSGMIKNVLPSLRQRAGPQRICSRQKSIRSGTARNSFSQTPHMRGKVVLDDTHHAGFRITPACAGKRASPTRCWNAAGDHPRVCGEKLFRHTVPLRCVGSPPHVRGKVQGLCEDLERMGITPACAGKSAAIPVTRRCGREHPRGCGEKMLPTAFVLSFTGSPPRMRGKEHCPKGQLRSSGITPAYAGKSRCTCEDHLFSPDHPRVCGEKVEWCWPLQPDIGSPPRMRGKVFV